MEGAATPEIVDKFEHARIIEVGLVSWYAPHSVDPSDLRANTNQLKKEHPALQDFERNDESVRDPTRRAIYWAQLQDRVRSNGEQFPLRYDPTIRNLDSVADLALPWKVALTTNRAAYAAYLAAHGKPNSFLADALDVSKGTVSQYLSDFKAERRGKK